MLYPLKSNPPAYNLPPHNKILPIHPTHAKYCALIPQIHVSSPGQHRQIYVPADPTPLITSNPNPTPQTPPRHRYQQDPKSATIPPSTLWPIAAGNVEHNHNQAR